MFSLVVKVVLLVVATVWLVLQWRIRRTLSSMRLDPDTVDAACLRVAKRQSRNQLWLVALFFVVQLVVVVQEVVE